MSHRVSRAGDGRTASPPPLLTWFSSLSLVISPGIYPEGLTEAQAYLDLTDNERPRLDSNSGSLAFTHCSKATEVDPDIKEVSRALVALGRQMPTGQDRIFISI